MKDVRKINERFKYKTQVGASDIYRKFKIQFDALFNTGEVAKTKEEFEKVYVHDGIFEQKIEDFRKSISNMASFCVGYTGIGKTTSIRYCFGLGIKNVSVYNEKRKELVFPAFFDGHNLETNPSEDLAKKISGVCSFVERENPELKIFMKSEEGLEALFQFIEITKPEILEADPLAMTEMSELDEIKYKLKIAREEHKYSYYAIRLKFLISQRYDKYERLIIILDDIESLPYEYQQDLIRLYLSFYDCMANTDYPDGQEYNVNMLICLRPHTLRLFNNRKLETYPISGEPITKDNAVDLAEMFEKRFKYYTDKSPKVIGNKETWNECYSALEEMNRMFSGQYKKMIINLCFMNIRDALSYYSKVFANRLWIQKNKEIFAEFTVERPDYLFNNITIIRALSCNESPVYFDDPDNILPCLFLNTKDKDYSIQCLLVLSFFYNRYVKGEPYGIDAIKKDEIIKVIKSIFDQEQVEIFEECIGYLFERRILRKGIRDKDDYKTMDRRDSLKGNSKLYLSSRGVEMWRMLSQDSVSLELFREEVYRDYAKYEFNGLSSFELMKKARQEEIFEDLLNYIEVLYYKEDDIYNKIAGTDKQEIYENMFGDKRVVAHLLLGVENSLNYSGKMENPDLKEHFNRLRMQIQ